MKHYQITSSLSISGETLEEAIGNGFDRIANELHIGNAAGYQLHQVWCEYDLDKQLPVLHIIATGSDNLVNYDPAKDAPVEKTLLIPTATQEDCPRRIDFGLKRNEAAPFDPFDDARIISPSACYGTLLGIINEIGQNHCKIKADNPITAQVTLRMPNLLIAYPLRYVEACRKELTSRRPKTDNETTRLMERVSELATKLLETPNDRFTSETIFRAKTEVYFDSVGKITALAKLRAERGMTQKQLAEAAQMSVRQLQNYEKCPGSTLSSASRSVPDRLAAALGVKRSDIVDRDGFEVLVNKN